MSKPALVIFDLDNTILNGDSDYAMINYLVHTQALDESAGKQNQIFIEDYQRGELDFDAYTTFALSAYIGMTRSEINEYMLPFVAKVIEPMINTLALKIIHDHVDQRRCHSSCKCYKRAYCSTYCRKIRYSKCDWYPSQIYMMANVLENIFLHRLLVQANYSLLINGCMIMVMRTSKIVTFYSDSINDLPLLEAVDFPKAVNPDAMLKKISLERGWEIIDLPIL